MNEDRKRFIELLAESGAVQFGDFTAKSGRKTPYFINTGKLTYGDQLDLVGKMYAQTYVENIGRESLLLFGPAYKGITLVAVTAAALYSQYGVRVPVCFNRKEKKDHGEGGAIVGEIPGKDDRIVIVEDVITAGTAIRETMELLKNLDMGRVESIIIAVDRMEKGRGEQSALAELEQEFGVKVFPIVTIREVVSYLHNREIGGKVYIDDALYARVLEYQKIYGVNSGD
ncbi:orotate phosphoribosyltransferase [Clostridiales bacterium FE2011]|nr:orotate phosphoribosyltransferase [Clostridiales bacterium FE2011]QTE73869.1 orotate phosphoribosyltransferase [Clostridiales bacterium FE2010]